MTGALSRRDHDCLEAVSALSSQGWPARVKDVAIRMNVTPPTAVGFLDKMVELALVEKGPSGYRLSPEGEGRFNEATRAHRLFETLLVSVGISVDEACRISSSLNGPIDSAELEKLCAHLSHPGKCPHGMPIPGGDDYD